MVLGFSITQRDGAIYLELNDMYAYYPIYHEDEITYTREEL